MLMRYLCFSLVLLSTLGVFGQAFTLQRPFGGARGFDPKLDIPGMLYFWSYQDLVVSNTVSSWVDRIQGYSMNQGNPAIRPTNSLSGVWFTGGMRLTNTPVSWVNAKWTSWIVFKPVAVAASFHSIVGNSDGNNGFFTSGPSLVWYTSGQGAHTISFAAINTQYDLMYTNTGVLAAGNAGGYTNTVLTATASGTSSVWSFPETMGSDNLNEQYSGYIKFVGFWTNKNLTATDMQNLYNYSQSH